MRKETEKITTNQKIPNTNAEPKAKFHRLNTNDYRLKFTRRLCGGTINMQNEPNFNPTIILNFGIHPTGANLFTRIIRTLPQKTQKIRTFCKFWTLTHLTPCTTKTYITFHPRIHSTRRVYPPSLWREKMQNKPNLTTSIEADPFTHSPIHFFMQNEPNSLSRIEYQESCIENMQNKPNLQNNTNLSACSIKAYENPIDCNPYCC